ncbi:MAG: tmRNA-binding protein SmpB, partial [uncultured Actinomycetospora sp.]
GTEDGSGEGQQQPTRATPQDRRHQPQGQVRLPNPRRLRGRHRAAGHRGQEPARGARVAERRLRPRDRRRGVAARAAHPGVRLRLLDQPRAAPRPQAAAAQVRDRPPGRQDPRDGPHPRPAVALLQRRQVQGRARPRARQGQARQARGDGRARRQARGGAGRRSAHQGLV